MKRKKIIDRVLEYVERSTRAGVAVGRTSVSLALDIPRSSASSALTSLHHDHKAIVQAGTNRCTDTGRLERLYKATVKDERPTLLGVDVASKEAPVVSEPSNGKDHGANAPFEDYVMTSLAEIKVAITALSAKVDTVHECVTLGAAFDQDLLNQRQAKIICKMRDVLRLPNINLDRIQEVANELAETNPYTATDADAVEGAA